MFRSQISQLTVTSPGTSTSHPSLCLSGGSLRCWFRSLHTELGWASPVSLPRCGGRAVLLFMGGCLSPTGPHPLRPASPRLHESHCRPARLSPRAPPRSPRSQHSAVRAHRHSGCSQRGKHSFHWALSQSRAYTCCAACPQASHDASPYSLVLSKRLLLTAQVFFQLH